MKLQEQEQQNNHHHHHPASNYMGLKRRSSTITSTGTQETAASVTTASSTLDEEPHHYGDLIGAIDQGTSSTRFLVFEKGTGRLVASSQIEIKRLTPREGWVEIDPNAIMSSVYATMANVHDQLLAKQHQLSNTGTTLNATLGDYELTNNIINNNNQHSFMDQLGHNHQLSSHLLKCIGICNQRESAVVWDSRTGQPLYNVIVWMDNRTKDIVDDMIDSIPGRDFNRLKDKTGLPMSTYFSAFKLRWLIDNVEEVRRARDERRLLVGTVDSWILWNLTGKHLTDVTNASRTFLMDIETLQWDKSLCNHFKIPIQVLPKILSSADDFGHLQFGPFMGTPVTGVIGDQSAALFGHNCLQQGQTKATLGTGCFIMQNIGPGPLSGALSGVHREAKRGLITTVAFRLKDKPVCYALEGSIKIAGAALTWLRDNMQLIENYEECDKLVNLTTNAAGVFFVPALGGLYSPYWDPNAAGLFIGLSQFSRREHLVRATFDAIAYQTNDILSLMHGVTNGLMIDGGLCNSDNLCQILADITGCEINRPSMCETSALGAAMVAGCGAGIWDYDSMMDHASNTPYEYSSSANQNHHYPHESLHYDDNKFSSLIQTKKTFKKQQPKHNNHEQEQEKQQQQQQQQHQLQHQHPQEKQQKRSLKHRDGGRLMRNLDAGGGINDDAGGGGGAGKHKVEDSGDHGRILPNNSDDDDDDDDDGNGDEIYPNDDDDDEEERASSTDLLASCLETEFDAGIAISSSGEYTGASSECNEAAQEITTNPLPAVSENNNDATTTTTTTTTTSDTRPTKMVNANGATCNNSNQNRLMGSLMQLNQQHVSHVCAPSSGYNSGDNFESAATNSAASCQLLTDSIRCRLSGSPTGSHTTDLISSVSNNGGRDSVATCTDLNHSHQQLNSSSGSCAVEPAQVSACNTNAAQDTSFPYTIYHSASNTMIGPEVQEQQDKFVAEAEDVADEVHEFGGRDSYGEEGYDSSIVSFDSYDDDDDDGDGDHNSNNANSNNDDGAQVARFNGATKGGEATGVANAQQAINIKRQNKIFNHNDNNDLAKTAVLASATEHHHHHHHHHGASRRHQASLLEKKMDVFQPYISLEHRTDLVNTWRQAVSRSMQWTKVHHEEIRRIDYQRLSSLPISMYAFFSIGMVALSGFLSSSSPPTLL